MQQFKPPPWLRSPHLQTLWPVVFKPRQDPRFRRERLELPDGDFVDLFHSGPPDAPVVLVFHGLEGGLDSHYVRRIMRRLSVQGWHAILMTFRGCSGEPNRLPRGYHSGDTGDIATLVRWVRDRYDTPDRAAIGYSLGGNALLKWLGEQGDSADIGCAVAVSVPFDLNRAAWRLERGFSRFYQWWLLRSLHASVYAKVERGILPPRYEHIRHLNTFRLFDDRITAPLHGFQGVDDYYTRSSCAAYLRGIRVPTLILHAVDDPFLPADAIPSPGELSSSIQLLVSKHGGHVGFITQGTDGRDSYWADQHALEFIQKSIETTTCGITARDRATVGTS